MFICLFTMTLAAQQPAPKAPPAPPAAPAAPAPPADPEMGGQPINIRLDVSVIDQTAAGATEPKSLMVLLVDRAMGRTRAAFQDRSVAVDARPVITDGRIRVYLVIQSDGTKDYVPPPERDHTINWRNSFSLLLENGKPMLALETNDAATKRKMSIEVKATIQK
ncbi:MAG: hypothetical protein ABI024_06785 [Vicinamibacterales bacterium]